MKSIMVLFSFIGLILTLIPSFLVFAEVITLENCKLLMLLGTAIWFVTAPRWIKKTT